MLKTTLPRPTLWLLPALFAANAPAALPENAVFTSTPEDAEKWIASINTVHPAPGGTAGPVILLGDVGEPLPADDPENPYAVIKLSDPSDAFLHEFDRAVENIESGCGFEMANRNLQPRRMLLVAQ